MHKSRSPFCKELCKRIWAYSTTQYSFLNKAEGGKLISTIVVTKAKQESKQ